MINGKRTAYKRLFKRLSRQGMFRAVVVDEGNEYSFPFIPERFLRIKRGLVLVLTALAVYLALHPPLISPRLNRPAGDYSFPDRVDEYGMGRLHRAVIAGNAGVALRLIRHGVNINAADEYGWTPLHWAYFLGREDLARMLTEAGAKHDVRSGKDWFTFRKGSLPEEVKTKL